MILPPEILDKLDELRARDGNGNLGTTIPYRYEALRDWIMSIVAERDAALLQLREVPKKLLEAVNAEQLRCGKIAEAFWNEDDKLNADLRVKLTQAEKSMAYMISTNIRAMRWREENFTEKRKCDMTGPCEEGHVCEERKDLDVPRAVRWFAEVNQRSKDACGHCKDLTWPKPGWISSKGAYLTSDPHEAKWWETREQALAFCGQGHVRHWHLYPTEHMFVS